MMRVSSVTVGPEAVEAVVRCAEGEPLRTSEVPGLPARALRCLPGLRGHRCDNAAGRSFSEELPDTELAHLTEHATLEIMALAGLPDTLRGATSWDFRADGRGVFRVTVGFDDDLVCLGALKLAGELVGALAEGAETPDVEAGVARLRGLRSRRA